MTTEKDPLITLYRNSVGKGYYLYCRSARGYVSIGDSDTLSKTKRAAAAYFRRMHRDIAKYEKALTKITKKDIRN